MEDSIKKPSQKSHHPKHSAPAMKVHEDDDEGNNF